MSFLTGVTKKVNLIDTTPSPDVGYFLGVIRNARLRSESVKVIREIATSSRRLNLLRPAFIVPKLSLNFDLQEWRASNDFILNHCIPSGEVARSKFILRYSDGTDDLYICKNGTTGGSLVENFKISCASGEPVRCTAEVVAESMIDSPGDKPSVWSESSTEKADWSDQVIKINDVTQTNWLNWDFGVTHNTESIQLGQNINPSETIEKEILYSGTIVLARTGASSLKTALAGTKLTSIAYLVKDKATPTTKTFLFTAPIYKINTVELTDLNLSMERIEWECEKLTIS